MKALTVLTIILAWITLSAASAQDLDQILKKHYEAVGQKSLLEVKTMKATGKSVMMGMESSFEMISKRPGKIRVNVVFQGTDIVQAYDGENAWVINPMMGSASAVAVTGSQADGIIESGDLDGQLWNYGEKGHQLALEGTREVNGKETYVLKLTKKNGNVDHYYLDTESYLAVMVKTSTLLNGSEVEVETLVSDYREVEGYQMPFKTEQKFDGQTGMTIIIEEVKVNEQVDDAIFNKPS